MKKKNEKVGKKVRQKKMKKSEEKKSKKKVREKVKKKMVPDCLKWAQRVKMALQCSIWS